MLVTLFPCSVPTWLQDATVKNTQIRILCTGGKVTAVVVTASGPAQFFAPKTLTTYDFTGFGKKGEADVRIYRTDGRVNMRCIQSMTLPAPVKFAIIIPPMSMTTVLVKIKRQYKVGKQHAEAL